MPTYTFQGNAVLDSIAPELITTTALNDPIFDIFPITPLKWAKLRWTIKDNMNGLMGLRGIGGEPTRVNRIGTKLYEATAGAYGEYLSLDEEQLTQLAAGFPANLNIPINVDDQVAQDQEQLTIRQVNRMRQICWLLAINNTFAIPLPQGGIGHLESYTGQTLTVSPLWSSTTTATPLLNLRSLQPTYGFGTSNKFNGMAQMWMNSITKNYLLSNTNAADLGGKRIEGGTTINDLPAINRILLAQDLPQIMVYDDGYYDDTNTFQLFIPTGKVLLVGVRPNGETPGKFQMTMHASANMEPRPYAFVKDFASDGPAKKIPAEIQTHQGFNGGPVVERPSQLVTVTVA